MTSTRLDRHKLFIPRIESHSLEQVASSRIDLTSAGWDLHFGEERSCVNLGIDGFWISIESIPKKSSRAQGRLDLGAGVPLLPWCRGAHNNTLAKHILKEFEVCQCICMHKGMSRTEAKHLCVGQFHVDSSHRVWPSQWEIQLLVATLTVSNSGKDACTDDAIVGHMALVTSIKICPVHATFSTGKDQGRFGLVGGSCSSASLEAWRLDAWHDSTKHRHDKLIIWMVLKKRSWGIWVCHGLSKYGGYPKWIQMAILWGTRRWTLRFGILFFQTNQLRSLRSSTSQEKSRALMSTWTSAWWLLQGFCLIQKENSMTRFSHDRRWQFTHLPLALPRVPLSEGLPQRAHGAWSRQTVVAVILEIFKPSSSKISEGRTNHAQRRPPVLSRELVEDVADKKKIERTWQSTRDTFHFPAGVWRASAVALTKNVVGAMTLCHRKFEVPSAGWARQAATAAAPAWDLANPVIAWNIFHQGPDETDEKDEKDMCTGLTDLGNVDNDNTGTREYNTFAQGGGESFKDRTLQERWVVAMHGWPSESTDGPKGGWSCVFWSGCNVSPHPQLLDLVWCSAAVVVV